MAPRSAASRRCPWRAVRRRSVWVRAETTGWKAGLMTRRAKIVCTLGPASASPQQIAQLVTAGLDVARLNMSHGTLASHLEAYRAVRAASDQAGRSVGVLVDLQGPKTRPCTLPSCPSHLVPGRGVTI